MTPSTSRKRFGRDFRKVDKDYVIWQGSAHLAMCWRNQESVSWRICSKFCSFNINFFIKSKFNGTIIINDAQFPVHLSIFVILNLNGIFDTLHVQNSGQGVSHHWNSHLYQCNKMLINCSLLLFSAMKWN